MIKETLQNGERHGIWEYYFINGQLREKGNYKNGKMDGDWIGFSVNGNINEEYTGNFKDGVKVN
jgi:antitoxin component YwqK of YwqJK toxin-antitoxin module